MYKFDGRWKANIQEFLNDTERIYDWEVGIFIPASFFYIAFCNYCFCQ